MALPSPLQGTDKIQSAALANITAATVIYIPLVNCGRVKRFAFVPTVVTATGSATAQLAYAVPGSSTFTNVANGLLTIASGTAAGVVTSVDLPPSTDAYVQDGGCLRITMGGSATGGGVPQVAVVIGV